MADASDAAELFNYPGRGGAGGVDSGQGEEERVGGGGCAGRR